MHKLIDSNHVIIGRIKVTENQRIPPPPPDHEMLYTQGIPGVTATFIFLHLSTFHTFSKVSNETCVSVVNEPIKIYLKHLYIHICI